MKQQIEHETLMKNSLQQMAFFEELYWSMQDLFLVIRQARRDHEVPTEEQLKLWEDRMAASK